jgi:hypothetical protein
VKNFTLKNIVLTCALARQVPRSNRVGKVNNVGRTRKAIYSPLKPQEIDILSDKFVVIPTCLIYVMSFTSSQFFSLKKKKIKTPPTSQA